LSISYNDLNVSFTVRRIEWYISAE
jgi:hypothetical protein